jgi:hypothetical protein
MAITAGTGCVDEKINAVFVYESAAFLHGKTLRHSKKVVLRVKFALAAKNAAMSCSVVKYAIKG